jgi:hypothetical protein
VRIAENILDVTLISTLLRSECRDAGFGCLYSRYRVDGRLEPKTLVSIKVPLSSWVHSQSEESLATSLVTSARPYIEQNNSHRTDSRGILFYFVLFYFIYDFNKTCQWFLILV